MTEITALYGQVEILSFAEVNNPFIGITPEGEKFATVSLGQTDQIVRRGITTQPNGSGLRFGIGGYLYTGLEEGTTVIATDEQSQDVAWGATYVDTLQAYLIYPSDDPGKVWTLQDSTLSDSPIILQSKDGSSSQGFKAQQPDSVN